MKIILSRKGLDGSFRNAQPSPILPCGRLLSLTIPVTERQEEDGEQGIAYEDLVFDGRPITEIINQLHGHNHQFLYNEAHLDPDLNRDRYVRKVGWKPTFGQQDGSQTRLYDKGVGKGDLFLFFGRFRRTRYDGVQLRYLQPRKGGRELHVIFGWLKVGDIIEVDGNEIPDWLEYHPHVVNREIYPNNTIYVAADQLSLENENLGVRGAGTFPCFKSPLQLTDPGKSRMGRWRLPKWFYPYDTNGNELRTPLSCHDDPELWGVDDNHAFLSSVPRGQEFVFDTKEYPEAIEWIKGLFGNCC